MGSTAIVDRASADRAWEIWEKALAAPAWQGAPVWLHGDLHPANVVVQDGTLAGVIDFGEMCAGDPATDLSAAWILLPGGCGGPVLRRLRRGRRGDHREGPWLGRARAPWA